MREKGTSYRGALYGAHGARVGRAEIVRMERGSSPMSPYGALCRPYAMSALCPFSSFSFSFSSFSSFSSTAFSSIGLSAHYNHPLIQRSIRSIPLQIPPDSPRESSAQSCAFLC